MPAHIDEEAIRHDHPVTLAVELARAKATAVLERLADGESGAARAPALLAADTVVAVAGEILEKPTDRDHARRMLALLSGRTHQVVTGVAVAWLGDPDAARPTGERVSGTVGGHAGPTGSAQEELIGMPSILARSCETHVSFAALSEAEIDSYLDSDEWHDVAGGYRVQGLAARYVTHLSGSYSNVVGLPLHLVYAILTGTRATGTGIHP